MAQGENKHATAPNRTGEAAGRPASPDKSEHGDFSSGKLKVGASELRLDQWQKEVLETQGRRNIVLRAGRQVGKSTVIAALSGNYAVRNKDKSILVISATERQAYLLFSKILGYLLDNQGSYIKKGKDRPTKSEIRLKNGSIIRCLPTGLNGIGIRGFTVDFLIGDEAAFIPDDVWPAVTPMLSTTGGKMVLLSTPAGTSNFFYRTWMDDTGQYLKFHINHEVIARQREEPQRSNMIEDERLALLRIGRSHYTQEYLGEFLPGVGQLFPDKLIKDHMTLKRTAKPQQGEYSMGVDVARMGGDDCTFEIFERVHEVLKQTENISETNILIPDTINKILELNSQWKELEKIYIDTGGMGVAVYDFLLRHDATRRKVVSIDNARRPIESQGWDKKQRKAKLMKEQLYINLKLLLEQDRIWFLDDEDIFWSLKSVMIDAEGKIQGNNTHIAEGIIRAAWIEKEKINKVWISYI